MKRILLIACVLAVAACGRPRSYEGGSGGVRPVAAGPISDACLASGRRASSTQLCGCIQAVANDTLSRRDQRRAVRFYADLHSAQETRQSDRSVDRRFWEAYTEYAERAERSCG